MQQTTKYQFNVIETSDTFSPAPLNENVQKLENALDAVRAGAASSVSAEAAARAAGDAALDQRVTVLEVHKFVVGSAPSGTFVDLGATPKSVVLTNHNGVMLLVPGVGTSFGEIKANGLQTGYQGTFYYVAFF